MLVQTILFCGSIYFGGTLDRLNQNSADILNERVINRKSYLENEMLQRWANLSSGAQAINTTVEAVLQEHNASFSQLSTDADLSVQALSAVSKELINLIRRNSTTGAFIILNGEGDIAYNGQTMEKACLYFRDLDPAYNSEDNSDLMVERAPSIITKQLGIPMDTGWQPHLTLTANKGEASSAFYYQPIVAAVQHPEIGSEDLGYWNLPFQLSENDREVITYSMPLISSGGVPYGVMGVEITTEYLQKLLPYDELTGEKKGSYLLGVGDGNSLNFQNVLSSGPVYKQLFGEQKTTTFERHSSYGNLYSAVQQSKERGVAYGCVQYFKLYNTNTPFEQQRWALIGVLEENTLFGFSKGLRGNMLMAFVVSLLIGGVCVVLTSGIFTRPIVALVRKVRQSNPRMPVKLERINIAEIDELANAIEKLSQDVADSASKLSQIIEMTSGSIGAFEYRGDSNQVFYTRRFFQMLGLEEQVSQDGYMDKALFCQKMCGLNGCVEEEHEEKGECLYRISRNRGETNWIRLKYIREESRTLGVVEDVSRDIMEKRKIEYERDYDILTNLLNRRAFHSILKEKFRHPENLRTAALIMMDLDNLKYINDTYGHDYGDQYIRYMADILREIIPPDAVLSRMSGDEFYAFLYGYSDKSQIRAIIDHLWHAIGTRSLELPDHSAFRIRASAGVAWYPDDSDAYEQLIRYADFAMYTVKNTTKGEFSEFDLTSYQKGSYLLHKKEELNKLIDGNLVEYHFQPIVDARTGEVFAYEALMRSQLDTLRSPMEILNLARSQSKMYQIERLTWFQSLHSFSRFIHVPKECKLFINSIANQRLSQQDERELERQYGDLLQRVVMELTENEHSGEDSLQQKQECVLRWNASLALDDFGSGYNSETMLLKLRPQYIKIDISIVHNVDRDENRLKLLQNLVSYSKERNILVIAEGVERSGEMEVLIQNGVDYMQGYYLGMPDRVPQEPSVEIQQQIREFSQKYIQK